ncbi:MAG: fibronectin type III domain-containing protein [Candidatus Hydrogenedentes bacterium]|nr:fibronectin type III domain-containing protein [Candidatus Hydrogenedentota bacterium]
MTLQPLACKFLGARLSLVLLLLLAALPVAAAPFNVYLLWDNDPATSIAVNYHTEGRASKMPDPELHYDVQPRGGDPAAYANHSMGTKREIPEFPVDRTLNLASVTGLQPSTTYYFVAGDPQGGYTVERSFRTLPSGDEPIRFVTGGDINVSPSTVRLLAQAGKQDTIFGAIGGDIAYVNGRIWEFATWDQWFKNYDENLRTGDGRMVPIFAAIGNHEVNDFESDNPAVKAPDYTFYFGQVQSQGMTYFSRQIGRNILLIALDTGHIAPHGGAQSAWLAETLAANQAVPYRFALYHVPLYPSHRPFEGEGSRLGRVHWEPYFNAYHLTTAFENHDHALKRSKLLKAGQPDNDGVLYIGDGCFGVNPRPVDPAVRPYLEHQASAAHIWVVDVDSKSVKYRAVGEQGETLDEYHQKRKN